MRKLSLQLDKAAAPRKNDVNSTLGIRFFSLGLAIFLFSDLATANEMNLYQESLSGCEKAYKSARYFDAIAYEACIAPIIAIEREVQACPASPMRQQQAAVYDQELLLGVLKDHGQVTVPEKIQDDFNKLLSVTLKKYQFPLQQPVWTLRAYKGKGVNAHAGAGGDIMLSDSLWTGEVKFTDEEIAAFMAHEIAHVVLLHSLKLGCVTMQWVRMDIDLRESTKIFREDFSVGTARGQAWSAVSQSFEYQADKLATRILAAASMDPLAMARALEKMKPKNAGGFSSGSHPETDDRIRAASDLD